MPTIHAHTATNRSMRRPPGDDRTELLSDQHSHLRIYTVAVWALLFNLHSIGLKPFVHVFCGGFGDQRARYQRDLQHKYGPARFFTEAFPVTTERFHIDLSRVLLRSNGVLSASAHIKTIQVL